MNRKAIVIIVIIVLAVVGYLVYYSGMIAPKVIKRSVPPAANLTLETRTPTEACNSIAHDVQTEHPLNQCSLVKAELFGGFDTNEKVCGSGTITPSGCFACTFECK